MVYYLNKVNSGISKVSAKNDGQTIILKWHRALPSVKSNSLAYNIYMNEAIPVFEIDFFLKAPEFVSVDGKLSAEITGLIPGQMYRFGVRPVEYDKTIFDLHNLPTLSNGLRVYPTTLLREDISAIDLTIHVLDVSDFPATGTIKIGAELIQYSSKDATANNFILTSSLQRGFNNSIQTFHNVDGYDGYETWSPNVIFFPIDNEDQNTVIFATESRFDNSFAFTLVDGYRQKIEDFGNANLSVSDIDNTGFPPIDLSGYNRIDPVALIKGDCVGSYFGGQYGCADGYSGVGLQLRGLSVQDMNTQREELELSLIGEPMVLVKRRVTGIRCYCILPTTEIPDSRCLKCYGGGVVLSYIQYFDSRNSDGKIRVRTDPYVDALPLTDFGLNSQETKPNAWTLVLPAIKARDFLVRFDADGNEEFRYEVINVGRNVLFLKEYGAQKLTLQRIRKTDPIYQFKIFKDTSTMPILINTSIVSSLGIPPHFHTITSNETSPMNWEQGTSVSSGHNHMVSWNASTGLLEVSTELGHSHDIFF